MGHSKYKPHTSLFTGLGIYCQFESRRYVVKFRAVKLLKVWFHSENAHPIIYDETNLLQTSEANQSKPVQAPSCALYQE